MVADESRLPQGPVISRPAIFDKLSEQYTDPSQVSDNEWRQHCTPEEFYVCRMAGTEPQFSGILTKNFAEGRYSCRCCGIDLFLSETKYWAHCGWPTFHSSYRNDLNIIRKLDTRFGLNRTEVQCKKCLAHLGHIFDDDLPESGERYCINSVALNFVKEGDEQSD
ncbi:Methionine-R-sulfoxide reductase B2, mitochondrial [Aphelenchoides besseyi]|nr:Methionine-R-sulfoxide reductase B2, mitochondrial [Aphelenchoides besseyi]KAI6229464.1 Methionine-R-sulfoxide reductase B2, mitochondrial [Aphelenchoides besseyi]